MTNYDMLSASVNQSTRQDARIWQNLAQQAQAAYQAGDVYKAGDFYDDLMNHSRGWLLSIAYRKLPKHLANELAEALVVQAHFQLWGLIIGPDPITKVKGLLGTIIRRRAFDAYRQQPEGIIHVQVDQTFWDGYREDEPSEGADPAMIYESGEDALEAAKVAAGHVNALLEVLTPEESAVLIARQVDGLTVEQTAARTGLTPDQVRKRRQAAMKRVAQVALERGL